MKRLTIVFIASFISFIFIRSSVYCQSVTPFVIASAGDFFISSNAQLSWTLGEVVTSTFIDGNSILTQGFQQNTYVITFITEVSENTFNVSVYPNPANRYLKIEWQYTDPIDLLINITNNQGINMMVKRVPSSESQIELDLNNFPNSIYILTISTLSGKKLKILKIVKI
jgi:hypothetical protein